jgi:hypothetical protein
LQDNTVERFSGSMHVETPNHHTHYDFVVDAVKDRVHLEKNLAINAVSCTGDKLHVEFNSTSHAATFSASLTAGSTVITILNTWRGCGGKSIIVKVAAASTVATTGTTCSVTTTAASITSLFKVRSPHVVDPSLLPPIDHVWPRPVSCV